MSKRNKRNKIKRIPTARIKMQICMCVLMFLWSVYYCSFQSVSQSVTHTSDTFPSPSYSAPCRSYTQSNTYLTNNIHYLPLDYLTDSPTLILSHFTPSRSSLVQRHVLLFSSLSFIRTSQPIHVGIPLPIALCPLHPVSSLSPPMTFGGASLYIS